MKARAAVVAVICGAAMPAPAVAAGVVVSEVYGGGGNTGAPLRSDFVELFNRTEAAVPLDGWEVGYASAGGTTWSATPLRGSIAPGGRYLIKQADGSNAGAAALPEPDATGIAAMSSSAGKVRLLDADGARVDLVAYGASATPFEGSGPAPGLSNGTSASRRALGCQDTDDNAADFTAGGPAPQSSAAAPTSCAGPRGGGAASPAEVPAGARTTLTVLSPTATSVTADLSAIGGSPRQDLSNPEGDESSTYEATVAGDTAPGAKSLPVTMRDAAGRTATTSIALTVLEACDAPATAISAIQGAGLATGRPDEVVSVVGVVVGDFQQPGGLGGVYVQSVAPDEDPATSEGLFVLTSRPVDPGDLVRVRGRATEVGGLTQLDRVEQATVCAEGRTVAPAVVDLPVAAVADLERFEGMAVRFTERLTVTDTFTLGRFGEVRLAQGGRLFTPTNVVAPGPAAQALADANRRRSLVLDDGSATQNPAVVRFPQGGLSASNTLRAGDAVEALTGVLDHRFGAYRVQPTGPVAFDRTPRPVAPPPVGGNVQVGAFNVLNFFDGPFPTARGASSATELARQTAKEVAALTGLDADVVGLMELENFEASDPERPDSEAIAALTDAVNAKAGAGTYAFVDTGVVGTDQIRVGLLYKPSVVRPVGRPAVLDSSVDPRFDDTRSRPSIAQAFEVRSTLETVTVVVNHLKSKGSACAGDPDRGDGQGNCNATRVAAAQALADWLAGDPTRIGHTDALVVGDLNSYAEEDPVRALRSAGYVDEIRRWNGPEAYSYVFDGAAGHLDHALASATLSPRVTRVVDWHINADEPVALDYNMEFKSDEQDERFYAPDAYRSSDHDPLLAGLALAPTYDGQRAAVRRHVTSADVRDGLLDKLAAAEAAQDRGQARTEQQVLKAYRNQLAAQAGKTMPEELAELLSENSTQL